jgi:diguanylate cyclase (GGDEF)-like protein/PAS domain S-box-containing protein
MTSDDGAVIASIADHQIVQLFERLPEMIAVLDEEGCFRHVNQTLLTTMGYERADVIGSSIFDYVHPDELTYMAWSWESRASDSGEPGLIVQGRARNADGTWRVLEIVGVSLLDEPACGFVVVTMRDISKHEALADSPGRLRSMVDRTTDIVTLVDAQGRFVYANRRLTARFGHDHDRVIGLAWTSILDGDDVERAERWFEKLVSDGESSSSTERLRVRDPRGAVYDVDWRGTNQLGDPLIEGVIMTGREITDLVEMERRLLEQNAQLLHASRHDPLTELLNRPAFVETMAGGLEARRKQRDHGDVVVLFCDLDGFKAINDQHGHTIGDRVLEAVGARLTEAVREGDVVGRYGGDEFTVLLADNATVPTVTGLVARLKGAIGEPIVCADLTVRVGVTIGVGRAPVASADIDSVLHDADEAMYARKAQRA